MFVVGVLSAVGAVAIIVIAALAGISSDRWLVGMVPIGLLLVFGGWIMAAYAPWKPPPTTPAHVMARALQMLAGDAENAP